MNNKLKIRCIWNVGGRKHKGKVEKRLLFSKQLSIPICEGCFAEHKKIIKLHEYGVNINIITKISNSAIDELYEAYEYINSEKYLKAQKEKEKFMKLKDELKD